MKVSKYVSKIISRQCS